MNNKVFSLLLASMATTGFAQSYTTYDFQSDRFNIVDEEGDENWSMLYGYFNHVSANGKYAVGMDEVLMKRAFVWCADNPEHIEMLGDYTSEIALYDVTNDGTLIGGIRNAEGVMYPAYKPAGGNWQMLTRGMERLCYEMAIDDYVNMALRAATPDGRYMAGSFYMETGEYSDTGWPVSYLVPAVWKDGKLEKIYDDLGIKEFMVWDISDDGSIICGGNTAGIGGSNPAFIRDGKLYELFQCGEERTVDTPDDVYGNTAGGICNNIDNEGNIYGYYTEPYDEYSFVDNYFVVPAGCDYAVFLDPSYGNEQFPDEYWNMEWYVCGGNGRRYTCEDSHLYSLLDCSDDGKVFVGGGVYNLGYGIVNDPQITVYDEPLAPRPDGIRSVSDALLTQGVSLCGRSIFVRGVYDEAVVYDANGALVARAGQGQPIRVDGCGVYLVRVAYEDGWRCFAVGSAK